MHNYFITSWLTVKREVLLGFRRRNEYCYPLLFFLLIALLFPLAMPPKANVLHLIGPGVIWVAVLLAIMLVLPPIFRSDFDDGSLEQMVLSPYPLPYLVFCRAVAQWLMVAVPLLVISPLVALMFAVSLHAMGVMLLTLLLGTPGLILWGFAGASLTAGLRNGGLLMMLLLLPLYVPTLIFAGTALRAADYGVSPLSSLAWLTVLLIIAVLLAPLVCAFALRVGVAYQ